MSGVQAAGEKFSEFLADLRHLFVVSEGCAHCKDRRLFVRILLGLANKKMRRQVMQRTPAPRTLEELIPIVLATEAALAGEQKLAQHNGALSSLPAEPVEAVSAYRRGKSSAAAATFRSRAQSASVAKSEPWAAATSSRSQSVSSRPGATSGGAQGKARCRNCGRAAHPRDACPATGKTCIRCGKAGHFANVCRSPPRTQPAQLVQMEDGPSSSSDDEAISSVTLAKPYVTINYVSAEVNSAASQCNSDNQIAIRVALPTGHEVQVTATADSGAAVNVAGPGLLDTLGIAEDWLQPPPAGVKLKAANQQVIECVGIIQVPLILGEASSREPVFVCPAVRRFLLSKRTCIDLRILHPEFPRQLPAAPVAVAANVVGDVGSAANFVAAPTDMGTDASLAAEPAAPAVVDRAFCRRQWGVGDPTEADLPRVKKNLLAAYSDVFAEDQFLPPMKAVSYTHLTLPTILLV